ncbi:MAG TPA: siroheme synthase CysG [Candidatus Binataceae bacterium]|jgi:uroporphyrin-III C-methyltransferase/precorrin-2 dehydrogenase/sirohydrochlorin ferrochelatase
MDWFPIFLALGDAPALVVGGGAVALRKARQLLEAGCRVGVVAPRCDPEFQPLFSAGRVRWHAAGFEPEMVAGYRLVIAATDDPGLNRLVAASANRFGVLVNVVDDPALCGFIMPAVVDRSPLTIAIGTGGGAPILAREIKASLEALMPAALGRLAGFMGHWRAKVRSRISRPEARRRLWERVARGPVAEHLYAGREAEAHRLMAQMIEMASGAGADSPPTAGEVYIVGAGPGDPELLTMRALRLMQQADVVLHDRLVPPAILALVRREAARIDVGKRGGGAPGWPQQQIHQTMIRLAREGNRVLRLKGGDPLIFGRGGEEMEALARAGVAYQVVPGITAASGCAAYAGIPLTHRKYARSCVLVSGHDVEDPAYDWNRLGAPAQTIVFYMALGQIEAICRKLCDHGLAGTTPAALVASGTTHEQEIVRGTLATLADLAARRRPPSPALLIVGEVAGLSESLRWFHPDSAAAADLAAAAGNFEDRPDDRPAPGFGPAAMPSDLAAAQVE